MSKLITPNDYWTSIRDGKDALEAGNKFFADYDQAKKEGRPFVAAQAQVGAKRKYRSSRVGANGMGNGRNLALDESCGIARRSMPGSSDPLSTGRDCANPCADIGQPCGADILGFHSLDDSASGFPLSSAAAGDLSGEGIIEVGPGLNCTRYTPRNVFFIGRDQNAGFGAVPALLTSAVISGQEQLAATGTRNAIPTDVFNLTEEPLPVNWSPFTTVQGSTLQLKFASYLGPTANVQIFGAFWGDLGYV